MREKSAFSNRRRIVQCQRHIQRQCVNTWMHIFCLAECRRSPTQVKKVIALFFIDVLLRREKSDLCYRRRIRSFSAPYSASAHIFINANFKFAEWCRSQDYFSLNYAKEENLLLVIGAAPLHCQRHIQLQGNSDFMSSERRCTMQNKKAFFLFI